MLKTKEIEMRMNKTYRLALFLTVSVQVKAAPSSDRKSFSAAMDACVSEKVFHFLRKGLIDGLFLF